MLSVLKLLVTLVETLSTILPLVDNGIQVWNAISINNTNFTNNVIHETTQMELRPTLSMFLRLRQLSTAFLGLLLLCCVCLFVTDATAKSRQAPSKEAMPIANADRY